MIKHLAIIIGATLLAVMISGCMSESAKTEVAEENESENIRYVEISLLDGTKVGGKYVSETAAFTTIIGLYMINPDAYISDANHKTVKDPNKYFVRANGAEISIKNSLINTMVTINEPSAMIEASLKEMNDTAEAIEKAAEERVVIYREAKEKRENSSAST